MSPAHIPTLGQAPDSPFPDPLATRRSDGLIACGGDLHPIRLLNAYRQGIFPWYDWRDPVLWWSPAPRAVMVPARMHISRRLRRSLRQGRFAVTADRDFAAVVRACAGPRRHQGGTWINADMQHAYTLLHQAGYAHSIEVRSPDGTLTGGLYGVALGGVFFAESKFYRQRDASKIALAVLMRALSQWHFLLCDCQIWNPHLERLGVALLPAVEFQAALALGLRQRDRRGSWDQALAAVNLRDW